MRMWHAIMAVMSTLGMSSAAPRDMYSHLAASVAYPRAILTDGMPPDWLPRLQEVIDNRLKPSSMRSVMSAFAHWKPVAEMYGCKRI